MVDLVTLTAGPANLVLAPELGGAIARLDVGGVPVLRPWDGLSGNPFSLACNPLVPFSNRMSQGGFEWRGVQHDVAPNLDGEALPIHGDGFQRAWSARSADQIAILDLPDGSIGPWRYKAQQTFELTDDNVCISLTVTNTSDVPLPFGLGFHPWFPRSAKTELKFGADTVWTENNQYLPKEELPLDLFPGWSFASSRKLPDTWINNAYTSWKGRAEINQGDGAKSCKVSASKPLDTAIVYSPSCDADHFCFEPVSHPVDAFHLRRHPGLQELSPGESMTSAIEISWSSE
ncbi:MAG: aldose 1-epimerase [Hyphomicrobiales bacterium]